MKVKMRYRWVICRRLKKIDPSGEYVTTSDVNLGRMGFLDYFQELLLRVMQKRNLVIIGIVVIVLIVAVVGYYICSNREVRKFFIETFWLQHPDEYQLVPNDIITAKGVKRQDYIVDPYYPARLSDSSHQEIPRIIMQTNARSEVPQDMYRMMHRIRMMNPEYEYYYFDTNTGRQFLQDKFGERVVKAYDSLIPGAYKADLLRVCFLLTNGGVYLDTGMVCTTPLREIIKGDDTFISAEDNNAAEYLDVSRIYNAVMMATPGHPILKATLDIILDNIENQRYEAGLLGITGPGALGDGFEAVLGKDVNLSPCKDYGSGVRLLAHVSMSYKGTGIITDCVPYLNEAKRVLFYTKYHTYKKEQAMYNKEGHYSELFHQRKVFRTQ